MTPRSSLFAIRSSCCNDRSNTPDPRTSGRNFAEILRLLDSCQLTAKEQLATPANWRAGEPVLIVPTVSDEAVNKKYPQGFDAVLSYLRYVDVPAAV